MSGIVSPRPDDGAEAPPANAALYMRPLVEAPPNSFASLRLVEHPIVEQAEAER